MSKRILLLTLSTALLFSSASAFAQGTVEITHTQTTLKTEVLGSAVDCGGHACTDKVIITVTNGTNVNFTDYHIRFKGTDQLGVRIGRVTIPAQPFSTVSIRKNNQVLPDGTHYSVITLSRGLAVPGSELNLTVNLIHVGSVDVLGRPSL